MRHKDKRTRDEILSEILRIVKRKPGIRASEINRQLGREHSAHYRTALIKQRRIRKEKEGQAVRYYPTGS